jgi:Pyridoxamine 5'-phosphate oxidase
MAMNRGPLILPMGQHECLTALGTVDLGRVAVTIGALPAIRPVRYAIHGGHAVFRAAPFSRLRSAAQDQVVAFQADQAGLPNGVGWTVDARGRCHQVTSPELLAQLEALALPAWHQADARDVFLRIPLEHISGHRVYW